MMVKRGQKAPRRLAVVAHYDASRKLAHHVRLLLEQLLGVCDAVVLVSTTGVDNAAAIWASEHPALKVVTRENRGYGFMSYREGIRHLGDIDGAEVVICNDSFVGPVVPMSTLFSHMDDVTCDFWGMTDSTAVAWHIQSYFMVFRPQVVGHEAFTAFWDEMEPLSDRSLVIERYELGLSRSLSEAGFVGRAYFEPDARDIWEGVSRHEWWKTKHGPNGALPMWEERTLKRYLHPKTTRAFNSTVVLADRILDGRLPILKLEVPRLDPNRLGADWLLAECERRYPHWFRRVRHHIRQTDGAAYANRHQAVPVTPRIAPIELRVHYRTDGRVSV